MMKMAQYETKINASWFEQPDKENSKYSAEEYDIYQFSSAKGRETNKLTDHRLTLRKNLRSGNFELVEHRFNDGKDHVIRESPDL